MMVLLIWLRAEAIIKSRASAIGQQDPVYLGVRFSSSLEIISKMTTTKTRIRTVMLVITPERIVIMINCISK